MINFDFSADLMKAEEKDGRYFIYGVASTDAVDQQNEVISLDAIKKMAKSAPGLPIVTNHNHEFTDEIGTIVEANVEGSNLVIKAELDKDDPQAVRVFNKLAKGQKAGFSVGGRIKSFKPSVGKSIRRIIDDVELAHIMVTSRPVNKNTFALALTKALDAIPEATMDNTEVTPVIKEATAVVEKAGAMFSGDNKGKLKAIYDAGSVDVKSMLRDLMGDDAEDALGPANLADGDGDDSDAVAEACNAPVDKAEQVAPFDLAKALEDMKSTLVAEIKTQIAKAVTVEPKGAAAETGTFDLAKATTTDLNTLMAESIRKSLGA